MDPTSDTANFIKSYLYVQVRSQHLSCFYLTELGIVQRTSRSCIHSQHRRILSDLGGASCVTANIVGTAGRAGRSELRVRDDTAPAKVMTLLSLHRGSVI